MEAEFCHSALPTFTLIFLSLSLFLFFVKYEYIRITREWLTPPSSDISPQMRVVVFTKQVHAMPIVTLDPSIPRLAPHHTTTPGLSLHPSSFLFAPRKMEVFIRDPDCVIEVGANDSVSHLKQKVVQETGLAVQALLLEGVRLPEEELCCCTDLVDGSVLDLVVQVDMVLLRKTWLKRDVGLCRAPSQLWTDEDFVFTLLMRDGDVSSVVPLTPLFADKAFMRRVVARQPRHLEHLQGAARGDWDVIYTASYSSRWSMAYFEHLPRTMQCDAFIVDHVARNSNWSVETFRLLPLSVRGRLRLVLKFVETSPSCLQYASTAMQNDWKVVLTHIKATPSATGMAEVPLSLRSDLRVMIPVMSRDACCLRDDSVRHLRGNVKVVYAAVRSRRWESSLMSLLENCEVLKIAVAKNPSTLQDVPALHNDTEFIMSLVSMNAKHLQHVPETVKGYRKVVLSAMRSTTWDDAYLQHVAEPLLSCIDVMAGPIKRNAGLLQQASDVIRSSRKLWILAIESRTWKTSLLQYAPNKLRADRKLVWFALQKDAAAVRYANPSLRDNKELMLKSMRVCPSVILPYVSSRLRADEDFMFECVMERTSHLQYASVSLRSDTDFMQRLLVYRRDVLLYASKAVLHDESFIEKCVAKYGSRIQLPFSVQRQHAAAKERAAARVRVAEKSRARAAAQERAAIPHAQLCNNVCTSGDSSDSDESSDSESDDYHETRTVRRDARTRGQRCRVDCWW